MQPGTELDRLVAERIGWRWVRRGDFAVLTKPESLPAFKGSYVSELPHEGAKRLMAANVPRYSTDLNYAMEAARKYLAAQTPEGGVWSIQPFESNLDCRAMLVVYSDSVDGLGAKELLCSRSCGDTLAHAICLAVVAKVC
jgi:hypothetical protein